MLPFGDVGVDLSARAIRRPYQHANNNTRANRRRLSTMRGAGWGRRQPMSLTQPFSWVGSKCRLRGRLYPIFATIPRALYVEPFGGSGAVFFGKSPENSVYNDCNRLLTNFFKVIRSAANRRMIQDLVEITPTSEIYFYEFRDLCLDYMAGKDCDEWRKKLNLSDYPADVAVAFAFFLLAE